MARTGAVIILSLALLGTVGCRTGTPAERADEPAQRITAAFQASQGQERPLTAALVGLLDDDSLAVRYYAIGALSRQTGTTMGYHYAAPHEAREAAAARWRRYVEKTKQGGQQ